MAKKCVKIDEKLVKVVCLVKKEWTLQEKLRRLREKQIGLNIWKLSDDEVKVLVKALEGSELSKRARGRG